MERRKQGRGRSRSCDKLERYREIVDDFEAFREACGSEKTAAVRKNPLKASMDFEKRLREEFGGFERSGWNPRVYRLPEVEKPGKSMMHWTGEYYVQEESAALPVELLGPEAGEKILDACAAPGGKATQIAAQIANQGTVVANDVSGARMKSLHANVYRTGSASVYCTNYDAANLPSESYDRILVDAPCTGEGDRARRNFEAADEDESRNIAELQKNLLKRASKLLDGGKLVYSTCTLSPWENEAVVDWAVSNTGLELDCLEPGIPHQSGVESFSGESFSAETSKAVRVMPHHLESGVIFCARFSG